MLWAALAWLLLPVCHVQEILEDGTALVVSSDGSEHWVLARPHWLADETAPYQAGTQVPCPGAISPTRERAARRNRI